MEIIVIFEDGTEMNIYIEPEELADCSVEEYLHNHPEFQDWIGWR